MYLHLLNKLPDLINNALKQIAESSPNPERPEAKLAREQLMYKLKRITSDMNKVAQPTDLKWSEEQIDKIKSLPRIGGNNNIINMLLRKGGIK